MLLLMVISALGFILSAAAHLCMIFNIYIPPRELFILIDVGFIAVFYPALIIRKKVRGETKRKDFNNAICNICPNWLSFMTSLLLMYALVWFVIIAFKLYSGSTVTGEEGIVDSSFRGFSGHWMVLYCLTFTMMYCCRKLVKSNKKSEEKTLIPLPENESKENRRKGLLGNSKKKASSKKSKADICNGCGKGDMPQELLFKIDSGQQLCAACLKEMDNIHGR